MVLEIDCRTIPGGGGQVLRSALALSLVTGKAFRMKGIRHGRPNPGMRAQHLGGVRAAALVSGAEVSGLGLGSTELSFTPKNSSEGGALELDVGTAGSATLVAQALLPALLFAKRKSTLKIVGGTHVRWSPPFEYMKHVLFPCLARFGQKASCRIERYGFFPAGGGRIAIDVEPSAGLGPADFLERGNLLEVGGLSCCSNLPRHIASRQAAAARSVLGKSDIEANVVVSSSPGSVVVLWARYENLVLGASCLGERGKKAEDVGREAAGYLASEMGLGAGVDRFLADQLLVHAALADGRSRICVRVFTDHILANVALIEMFCGRVFKLDKANGTIVARGIGL